MANPLPEEKLFYERIRTEHLTITPEIWDLLYHRIGDDLSAINLICQYYIQGNQPIPVEEAAKILKYNRNIKGIISKVTAVIQKDSQLFPDIVDVYFYGLREHVGVIVPDVFEKLFLADHAPRASYKVL